ncbi:MAG: ferredoxin family protein [Heliobacteriaceae bacterium]|nr:ferredoxin family protein [Heliobacteriaceae bacterium]MDD4587569.1 ferredoxin family protein [Heliobacteriaceae bacterium]
MAKISFMEERCKGCGLCVAFCPRKCLRLSNHLNALGYPPAEVAVPDLCTACAVCARMCPDVVIEVTR